MTPSAYVLVPSDSCKISVSNCDSIDESYWLHAIKLGADAILAFQPPPTSASLKFEFVPYSAIRRFFWPPSVSSVCILGAGSATSFLVPLAWDLLHSAPLGAQLTFIDLPTALTANPVSRKYYQGWTERNDDRSASFLHCYRKTSPSPSEADTGLSRWSFAVPMERPNAGRLKDIEERVTSLGLEEFELLVCTPARYDGAVPRPWKCVATESDSETITRKKNRLVDAATLSNVCIFHDRLQIPHNFHHAMARYGDHFGLLGFQNIFIDPGTGRFSRYSDFHVEVSDNADLLRYIDCDSGGANGMHSDFIGVRQQWRTSFVEALPSEYSERSYLTGSLYLTKRSVWRMCGQDPSIEWNALEDVEFGHRCADWGIPSRVNAYAFARTLRIRTLLADAQAAQSPSSFGGVVRRPVSAPSIRAVSGGEAITGITVREYQDRILGFALRWTPRAFHRPAFKCVLDCDVNAANSLAECLIDVLYLCFVFRVRSSLEAFLNDFSSSCLASPMDSGTRSRIVESVLNGAFLLDEIITSEYFLRHIISLSQRPFCQAVDSNFSDKLRQAVARAFGDDSTGVIFAGNENELLPAICDSI